MKHYLLILGILLGFITTAHSMEVLKLVKHAIKEKSTPKYLCVEAGYGDELGVQLTGETNLVVLKVQEYTGSNYCYDFYVVKVGQKEFQVRVYSEGLRCELPGVVGKGIDSEIIGPPTSIAIHSLGSMEERVAREIVFSSVSYINKDGKIATVDINRGYPVTSAFAGYHANNFEGKYLGKIGMSCGPYVLINKKLYKKDRLTGLHTK